MGWPEPSVVDVLAAESARAAEVVLALDEEDFALPTRCPPWDVKALLGHLYRDVDRILAYRDQPAGAPDATGASYFGGFDPVANAPDGVGAGPAGRRRLRHGGRARPGVRPALAGGGRGRPRDGARPADRARSGPRSASTSTCGPGCSRWASTGWTSRTPSAGSRGSRPGRADVVRAILIELLGGDPPAALGWDDVTFFDTATGRRALTDTERDALGERADRFPLLA